MNFTGPRRQSLTIVQDINVECGLEKGSGWPSNIGIGKGRGGQKKDQNGLVGCIGTNDGPGSGGKKMEVGQEKRFSVLKGKGDQAVKGRSKHEGVQGKKKFKQLKERTEETGEEVYPV